MLWSSSWWFRTWRSPWPSFCQDWKVSPQCVTSKSNVPRTGATQASVTLTRWSATSWWWVLRMPPSRRRFWPWLPQRRKSTFRQSQSLSLLRRQGADQANFSVRGLASGRSATTREAGPSLPPPSSARTVVTGGVKRKSGHRAHPDFKMRKEICLPSLGTRMWFLWDGGGVNNGQLKLIKGLLVDISLGDRNHQELSKDVKGTVSVGCDNEGSRNYLRKLPCSKSSWEWSV